MQLHTVAKLPLCGKITCAREKVCVYEYVCVGLPAVVTSHITTPWLFCFHIVAAYMPVVHTGGMGGAVRTHGIQLHLLRYSTWTHTLSYISTNKGSCVWLIFHGRFNFPVWSDRCRMFPMVTWKRNTLLGYVFLLIEINLSFSTTNCSTINGNFVSQNSHNQKCKIHLYALKKFAAPSERVKVKCATTAVKFSSRSTFMCYCFVFFLFVSMNLGPTIKQAVSRTRSCLNPEPRA